MDRVPGAFGASLIIAFVSAVALPASAATIPIASVSAEPQMRAPSLSLDGSKLVFVTEELSRDALLVQERRADSVRVHGHAAQIGGG
jgi:hypothetical protein